jgi:hypothetical protein
MARFVFYTEDSGRGEGACGVCGNDFRQSSPPELRYVKDKRTGKMCSIQCCVKCLRMVAENQRAEKAIAEHEQAQKEKIGRIPDPIVQPEPVPEPTPVPTKFLSGRSGPNGKNNKRTAKSR